VLLAFISPSGNAISQRFERNFHVFILKHLVDWLLIHQ